MKTLYLDCSMGVAGDMLAAALLELLPDPEAFVARLNGLGLPGVAFAGQRAVKCGITGTHLSVTVHGAEEESHDHHHDHDYHHNHDHHHGHHHGHDHHHGGALHPIGHLVDALPVSEGVKGDVMAVYTLLAQAESAVHGVPVDEIHFHEVGTLDAVADVTAVCLLMEALSPDEVVCSPVRTGFGQVRCAHGILPVPAPAAARLLLGVPVYAGDIEGELCTPTGAALLKHFAGSFGPMPPMTPRAVGYGMGTKDFPAANCVRATLGEREDAGGDTVCELACNLDDMTGEAIGFAMERLFEAGAVDVYTTPIGMKKSRPGVLLTALCREGDREAVLTALFRHTTTLGVRESLRRRTVLRREETTANTPFGPARRKHAHGFGALRAKWEHADAAALARARGISLAEARALLDGSGK